MDLARADWYRAEMKEEVKNEIKEEMRGEERKAMMLELGKARLN